MLWSESLVHCLHFQASAVPWLCSQFVWIVGSWRIWLLHFVFHLTFDLQSRKFGKVRAKRVLWNDCLFCLQVHALMSVHKKWIPAVLVSFSPHISKARVPLSWAWWFLLVSILWCLSKSIFLITTNYYPLFQWYIFYDTVHFHLHAKDIVRLCEMKGFQLFGVVCVALMFWFVWNSHTFHMEEADVQIHPASGVL